MSRVRSLFIYALCNVCTVVQTYYHFRIFRQIDEEENAQMNLHFQNSAGLCTFIIKLLQTQYNLELF